MEKINLAKSLVLSVMIALATVANATEKSEPAPAFRPHFNRNAQTEWFYTTKVNAPVKVQFVRSHKFSVAVVAEDAEVAKGVKCSIKKGVLSISKANGMSDEALENNDVTVIISSPMLPELNTDKDYTIE
ncbi:MAG: DUF2807 domain-containing protein [Bacteroidaceae bacterium]|nr:DUF2807 domain-containing protein [Bacteroidaceae bacterium]